MSLKGVVRMARYNARITPKMQAWLTNHPEGVRVTSKATMKRVQEILMEKPKPRSGAFHPSQFYTCPRAQMFGYYGVPTVREFNPQLQNIFNDGHFRHLRWQVSLLEAGILTDIEVPVNDPIRRIEGSMDGVNTNENWMFELKGTSQFRQIQQKGALPAHIKQVNAYLFVSGIPEAVILYEDKSTQNWQETTIYKDDKVMGELIEILDELNYCVDNDELPERYEDCENQTGATFNACPYQSVCLRCDKPSDINP